MTRDPIFIGGTGRSGTSIMAQLLDSHPDVALPSHENKLIAEAHGVRDVVNQAGARWDPMAMRARLMGFRDRAMALRWAGFNDPKLNTLSKGIGRLAGKKGFERHAYLRRVLPNAAFTWHGTGKGFGLKHWEACVEAYIDSFYESPDGRTSSDRREKLPKSLTRDEALQLTRDYHAALYGPILKERGATTWCDDTPSNFLYVDFLHELYPGMKFIHMARDPRDVVSSYDKQVWSVGNTEKFVISFKRQFAAHQSATANVPADQVMTIKLEDLVQDKEATAERVATFLGLEQRFDLTLVKSSKSNMGRFDGDLSTKDTDVIARELGPEMTALGYTT